MLMRGSIEVNERLGTTNIDMLKGTLIALAVAIAVVAVTQIDFTGKKGSGLGKEFEYNIEGLGEIDPSLILYKESAKAVKTGFKKSSAIAIDYADRFYVAGDKSIRIFSPESNLIGRIELDGEPDCLTVGQDGRIYVGVGEHVEVYDSQGKRESKWLSVGSSAALTSIAVSKKDVFVADAGNRIVVHYDMQGNVINRIGKKDSYRNIPGFVIPSPYFDLAVGPDGLLRVVNPGKHRIEAYTFAGDLEFWWGEPSVKVNGFSGCCNPVNFAILGDGSFVTCEKGLVRVKTYDADGKFVGAVAGPEQLVGPGPWNVCDIPANCQSGSFDVAVDSAGRVYVLDTIKNVVRIFSKKES